MLKELEQGINLLVCWQQLRLFEALFAVDDILDSVEVRYSQSQFLKEKDVFKCHCDTVQNIADSDILKKKYSNCCLEIAT